MVGEEIVRERDIIIIGVGVGGCENTWVGVTSWVDQQKIMEASGWVVSNMFQFRNLEEEKMSDGRIPSWDSFGVAEL